MYPYAHVRNGAVVERRSFPEPLDPAKIKHVSGEPAWRPVVTENDEYDPATEVRTGPVVVIQANQVVDQYTVEARDLAVVEAEMLQTIDRAAEATRQVFITPGDGQAMNYLDKRTEAEKWQADGSPDPANYPRIKARAERLNPSAPDYQAVVDDWLLRADDWKAVDVQIDTAREGGKDAVSAAIAGADVAAAQAAVDQALATFAAIKAQA